MYLPSDKKSSRAFHAPSSPKSHFLTIGAAQSILKRSFSDDSKEIFKLTSSYRYMHNNNTSIEVNTWGLPLLLYAITSIEVEYLGVSFISTCFL